MGVFRKKFLLGFYLECLQEFHLRLLKEFHLEFVQKFFQTFIQQFRLDFFQDFHLGFLHKFYLKSLGIPSWVLLGSFEKSSDSLSANCFSKILSSVVLLEYFFWSALVTCPSGILGIAL